jgi:hypothetical protein
MSTSSIVLIAGDRAVAERVQEELSGRNIACQVVDPAADKLDEDRMFDLAFEQDADGVLLIEPLGRCGGPAPAPDPTLLRAALAATKPPSSGFLGWVTSRSPGDEEIAGLKRSGLPYGILCPGPVFDMDVAPAAGGSAPRQVLVSRELADELAAAQASTIGELATEIATWVELEWVREGRIARPPITDRPLEHRLEALGVRPLLLSDWRVALNAFFGLPIVELGGSEGTLVIQRHPLRLGQRRQLSRGAAASHATDGSCAEAALAGA